MNLRDELETIYRERGRLTPDIVVNEARPDNHPLHAVVFDRPPDQAAESWYRQRAHELIQSVKITYAREDKPPLTVRAYHAVRDGEGFAFRSTDDILADPLLTKMLLADMKREWLTLRQRYEHFAEFRELVLGDLQQTG